jgi:hypothetical protein
MKERNPLRGRNKLREMLWRGEKHHKENEQILISIRLASRACTTHQRAWPWPLWFHVAADNGNVDPLRRIGSFETRHEVLGVAVDCGVAVTSIRKPS